MRVAVLLVTAAAVTGPATAEAVTPLARTGTGEDVAVALAGEEALYTRGAERILELRAVPVAGGPPVPRLRFEAPEGAIATSPRLAASAQVAALTVTTEDDESTLAAFQAFGGPPVGPLEPLIPLTRTDAPGQFPTGYQIDGSRTFTFEISTDLRRSRVVVREPGAEPAQVKLPRSGLFSAVFAGELVAYGVPVPGQPAADEPRRLVVAEWRTGRRRATVPIPSGVESLALAPSGRVIVGEDGGGLLEVAPGDGGVRRLSRIGVGPVLAGNTVVARRGDDDANGGDGLIAVAPDRRVRRFGVPSAGIDALVADDRRVLWRANGCLLTAPPEAGAATAPDAGPCPRSELFFDDVLSGRADRRGRLPILLRCVAAAPPGCRGSVRLESPGRAVVSTTAALRIPAGQRRRPVVRLTRRGRRLVSGEGNLLVVRATAADPAGRRTVLRVGHGVSLPVRREDRQ